MDIAPFQIGGPVRSANLMGVKELHEQPVRFLVADNRVFTL